MRRRLLARLLAALLAIPLLSGCWNRVEIEEGAFVLALGVDKGKTLPYSITVMIAKPGGIAGKDGGGKEKPVMLTTVEAPSLAGALSMLNGSIGRQVNLHHTRALFMHADLARANGIHILDELTRFRQTRQTIFFIVTREKAGEFLNEMKPSLEKNPMRYIEQLTFQYQQNAMLPADGQINTFISQLDVAYAQPLAYYAALVKEEEEKEEAPGTKRAESGFKAGEMPREGGPNVEMIGAAAFRRGRMVGVLTGEEVRQILLLRDEFRQAFAVFPDPREPDRYISLELNRNRPFRMQADLTGPHPRIRGTVSLEAEILGVQSGIDYSEPEMQVVLEESIARELSSQINKVIAKTQKWEADVVGFGRHLVPLFPTVAAWESFGWPERFPDTEFSIGVEVRLRRFGLILSPVKPGK